MAKSIKVSNINNSVDFDQFTTGKDCAKHMHVIMNVKRNVNIVMESLRTALSGIFEELLWRLNYGEYNIKTCY